MKCTGRSADDKGSLFYRLFVESNIFNYTLMNVLGLQFIKGAALLLLSYVLLAAPDLNQVLSFFDNILLATIQYFDLKIENLSERYEIPITTIGMFGLAMVAKMSKYRSITGHSNLVHDNYKNLIGNPGIIKSIDGIRYVSIGHHLYQYVSADGNERKLGKQYLVLGVEGDALVL